MQKLKHAHQAYPIHQVKVADRPPRDEVKRLAKAHKGRQITVYGEQYFYSVGKDYLVLLMPHDGTKRIIGLDEITHRSPDTIERGRWKKTSDGMVTPRDVVNYIKSCITGVKIGGLK